MLLIDVVHEIFALEDAVSFNFALGAPHVKRRVKSRRPATAAPSRRHGGQPVGATVSCAHFKNGVDSRALYPGASSEGSRQRSHANQCEMYWDV